MENSEKQEQSRTSYSVDYDTGLTYSSQLFNIKYDKEKKTFVTVAE